MPETAGIRQPKEPRPRNITAPPDCYKLIAGPFIYALEEFYDKVDPSYCGRKNWGDLSVKIQGFVNGLKDPVIIVGDGSSFDST
jgi:hypothetical protein